MNVLVLEFGIKPAVGLLTEILGHDKGELEDILQIKRRTKVQSTATPVF